jgi:hypothetical protein
MMLFTGSSNEFNSDHTLMHVKCLRAAARKNCDGHPEAAK